jgi:RNA polymerase sigma-70 factor (ECF subfamily)
MSPSSSNEEAKPERDLIDDPTGQGQLPELFESFRHRLRSLVEVRIDRRIRARLDASDIVQEAFVDAVRRFPEYQKDRKMTPCLWFRFLALQQLTLAHRRHPGVKARAASREHSVDGMGQGGLDSSAMAYCLVGNESTPSAKVTRAEEIVKLTEVLESMEALDREVLALRHFDQLEHSEIAAELGMTVAAVSSRYRRALKKMGQALKRYGTTD